MDPVVPPSAEDMPPEREEHVSGLAEGAQRRRSDWPNREEARAWWAERPLFEDWQPEAIDLYALDGLRERDDGSVELKCPGAVEASVFQNGGALDVPSLVAGMTVPTRWLWAARGNFPVEIYELLAATMEAAEVETLDAGHLVPMEHPALVVEAALRAAGSR